MITSSVPLLQLQETILRYEEQAGLPSSKQLLDELAAERQQPATRQQPAAGAADGAEMAGAAAEQQAATEDQETTAEAPEEGGTALLSADAGEAAPKGAAHADSKDEL